MRELLIKESDGLYYIYGPRGEFVAASLEDLLNKADPGETPARSLAWAETTEFLLGPARHGLVVDGLADTRDR